MFRTAPSLSAALLCAGLLTACRIDPPPETLASVALTCSPTTVQVGGTARCAAQGKTAAGTVLTTQPVFSFASSAPSVAAVSGSGVVIGASVGTATVTATSGGVTSGPVSLSVTAPPPDTALASIELNCTPDSIEVGRASSCAAQGKNAAGTVLTTQPTFEFRSSDPGVATISATGVTTGVGPGNTSLTARSAGVTSDPFTLTVTAPPAQGRGTLQVTVRDAASQAALSGVTFELCRTAQTCATQSPSDSPAGVYTLDMPGDTYARLALRKSGYRSGEYLNLPVPANQTTVLEQFLAIDNAVIGDGTLRGRVVSATTAQALENVTVTVYPGLNTQTGTPVASTTTDSAGAYALNLPTGYYSVVATLDGYVTTSYSISVLGGRATEVGDKAMSPVLSGQGQWRVVLNWGAAPSDLDSHLTGPDAQGGRFHVYFRNPLSSDRLGSVNLDVDDISSYGPETITVTDTPEGLLRYSVHDFSNSGQGGSGALSRSGARVQLYRGDQLTAVYNVPSGSGDLWTVFTLDLSNPAAPILTPVNTVGTVGSSYDVQRVAGQPKTPVSVP